MRWPTEKLPMRHATLLLFLSLWLAAIGWSAPIASPAPVPGDPLTGNGNVHRSVLTDSQLLANMTPATPVDDTEGFAVPANAAAPSQTFEGALTLADPASRGSAQILRDDFGDDGASNSPWRHLPPFSFQFVQNGSYLIPVKQGLVITGNPAWNYIVGPGRVWK